MKVILIRHGQTDENVAGRHQPTYTPLSIIGRKQAVAAGKNLEGVGITHIVASPLVRTLQTASLIADKLDLIPSIDHALVELIRPQSMTGHGHNSGRSLFFYFWWYAGLSHSGESYRTIRARIMKARVNLEKLPSDATVAVVSHSVFISLYIAHVCQARPLGPVGIVRAFMMLKKMKNTGMYEYDVAAGENLCAWVRTNDLNLS
jgi:broad specificity phosphatase PhoE